MKTSLLYLSLITLALLGCKEAKTNQDDSKTEDIAQTSEEVTTEFEITPISHATSMFKLDSKVFYTDPVGGAEAFDGQPSPDLILVTDIHGDHFNLETLEAVSTSETKIIVPQAVADQMEGELTSQLVILKNEESKTIDGFKIEGVAMYNQGDQDEVRHVKGRGNGYVIEKGGMRIYFSGDTEAVPEMRALKNIDKAFVCMNLPYTMSVDAAAEGVLAFQPKEVYPYHYRGQGGLADVEKFKNLVDEGKKDIQVELLNWYPTAE
ncbi:MBL fold metallo-hydrolase [Psychroflexus montanilacus]|uniref:MBL fold metallo-hydrolase n=1 Tax=Psychroflexus montanilacus TaxID=2873598 RepID=UPI001CC97064|nr:MBL fold metallo-hydrolase [Psychroflexus montanilacus]MBZ9652797.1 MBL fold metallo-hydrolase [Psychroflexus montanilacus]